MKKTDSVSKNTTEFLGYVWLFFIGAILGTGMDLIFVTIQRFNRPRMIRYLNRKNKVFI